MSGRKAELERKKAMLETLKAENERRRREKDKKNAEVTLPRVMDARNLGSHPDLRLPTQTISPDTSLPYTDYCSQYIQSGQKKLSSLQVISVQSTDIPPIANVTYTKQTQTTPYGVTKLGDAHATDYYVIAFDDDNSPQDDEEDTSFYENLPLGILRHGLPTVKEILPAVTDSPQKIEDKEEKKVGELSADKKQKIMMSLEFQQFMSRSGRVIERALAESVDIFTDYIGGAINEDALDDVSKVKLSLVRTFHDERWSRGRCVTCVDWSAAHPELMLASYYNSDDAPHDPDGVCLVWNTKFKKTTPEDIFHCQSPVMSATFARFHPNLILGGTYSGQLVMWDNRVTKRTPVQRTRLSSLAHTHPVYCVSVVGSQNAHNLISVSTEGRMCSWSLDMLSQPQESLDLKHIQLTKKVAVTSMGFPHGDINNFVLGSEDGNVYTGCLYGQRAGVTECVEAHAGPITGVSCHAAAGAVDLSHLYLTCSMDWSVKLWSQKENKVLHSFEDNDYVVDVSWSPVHPALFAAANASGRLDLWNLNRETEVPVASIQAEDGVAFNKLSWSPDGTHVTAGNDFGKIWVYELAEDVAHPHQDDWSKFVWGLQELRNNQIDEETERLSFTTSQPSSLTSYL